MQQQMRGVITILVLNHLFTHLFSLPPLNMSAHPIDQAFFCFPEWTEEQVPARHMLLNCADHEEDEDIRDEDVIHSAQGLFCAEEEIEAFKLTRARITVPHTETATDAGAADPLVRCALFALTLWIAALDTRSST